MKGDGYPGGWEGQPTYGMPPGYPGGYPDYSAYYGQQAGPPAPAYGAYGQPPPAGYPMPDPYAQAYAAAAAAAAAPAPAVPSSGYDYSAWYSAQPGGQTQQNGGGPMYGGAGRGQRPPDNRYQPY